MDSKLYKIYENNQNLTINVVNGNNEIEKSNGPICTILKIFLKISPDKSSTNSPEIPDKTMPIPIEINHSVIIEIVFGDHPKNASSIPKNAII